MLAAPGRMMRVATSGVDLSELPNPFSLYDGDPALNDFSGEDIICQSDGNVWGDQGTISNGMLSGSIEVESGVDVLIAGVTFSGNARAVIDIANTEDADAVNVVLQGVSAPEGSTITVSNAAVVTLTVDGAVFDVPYEFRNYLHAPGDPTQILLDPVGGVEPIYA